MATNIRKTLTDAGYIAVGLTVMGVQQAQVRGRELRERANQAGSCMSQRTHDLRMKVESRTKTAREQAEVQVRSTVTRTTDRTKELRGELTKRVEPVVGQAKSQLGQVQSQFGEIPERVVQAMEPVTARFRQLAGNAA